MHVVKSAAMHPLWLQLRMPFDWTMSGPVVAVWVLPILHLGKRSVAEVTTEHSCLHFLHPALSHGLDPVFAFSVHPRSQRVTHLLACRPHSGATTQEHEAELLWLCLLSATHRPQTVHWLPSWTESPAPQSSTSPPVPHHWPTKKLDLLVFFHPTTREKMLK